MTDASELKACPFCGCKVELAERKRHDALTGWRTWYHIEGKHEGIGGVCPGQIAARGSAETAIAAWNTRTTEAELRAEIERLNRMRVHCDKCGGDYAATGVEVGCKCEVLARLDKLTDRANRLLVNVERNGRRQSADTMLAASELREFLGERP